MRWTGCEWPIFGFQFGRLRTELRELDLRENTLVWYCSDNGALLKKTWLVLRVVSLKVDGSAHAVFRVISPALNNVSVPRWKAK
jgi:arylsulfatase A-like enzyme